MTCLRCQRESPRGRSFCPPAAHRQHGAAVAGVDSAATGPHPSEQKIAGVCAGIADYLDVDVTLVRALWLALYDRPGRHRRRDRRLCAGVDRHARRPAHPGDGGRRLVRSATDVKVAGVCGGLADYFGVDATPIRVLWIVLSVLPGGIIGGLLAYLAAWLIVPKAPIALTEHQPHAA